MNEITVFGVLALTFMMAMYSLEGRHRRFTLAFAFGCLLSSAYGFVIGAWPVWSRRDRLVCVCAAEVSIAKHQPSFKLRR